MIVAGILFFVGGVKLINRDSYWPDGTRKISRREAEQNISDWAEQTRREFRGGKNTKKRKQYK